MSFISDADKAIKERQEEKVAKEAEKAAEEAAKKKEALDKKEAHEHVNKPL